MARSVTAALNTQLTAVELEPFFLVDLEFDSGTMRFWTGIRPLTWNGNEYIGAGNLIGISQIAETAEVRAVGVSLTMSGFPAEIISIALSEAYQGQPVKIRFGAMSSDAVVADPYLVFDGRMDVMTIDDSGSTATVSLSVESRLIDLERPRLRRYTPEDQKTNFPEDTGMDFVPTIQNVAIQWGR